MSAVLSDADVKAIKRSLSAVCTHEEAIQATVAYLAAQPESAPAINASGAVYLLLGSLTCRDNVPPLGAGHDAAPWAQIAKAFCEKHGLTEEPRWPGIKS